MMSEEDAIQFVLAHLAFSARSMPSAQAANLLRGALCLAGDRSEVDPLRTAYISLCRADDQLELIAASQLKLNLGDGKDGDGK